MSWRFAICLATLALAGCGTRSFVMPAANGALIVTASSGRVATGAEEKAQLMPHVNAYCTERGKSAVVVASSETDRKQGTLAAPGALARATIEFRCE